MKRYIFKQLQTWKNSKKRKPLILMGARQVGKTYILKAFGAQEYENIVYLNFEDNPDLKKLFDQNLTPAHLIKVIQVEYSTKIKPAETLIFFDEVQECPNALNCLKYFNESANEYHVCAAGSLLGVKLINQKGFPVGKVDFLHLYPLSFFEFLDAIGSEQYRQYLDELIKIEPIPEPLHSKLIEHFRYYLYIGGMPEAIKEYIDSGDFNNVRAVQHSILNAYKLDFSKHAPANQIMKINQVWEVIPSQLAKENKKFIYSIIRKGARAKEFEVAIQWLLEAGLIYKAYSIKKPQIPLNAYTNFEYFKIYFLDVGLLGAVSKLSPRSVLQNETILKEFKGAIAENYAVQALMLQDEPTYYWTSDGKAEVDFIFQNEDIVCPLEIKSGRSDKKKSLRIYAEKYHPNLMIRASTLNLRKDNNFLNCPLYLLSQLKKLLALQDTT
ncbi:MAG: ATP-binding protein [Gammaproteobacteria bacterium]|nr:ATP-binding protein [Gammaproteobacteria bacterium]